MADDYKCNLCISQGRCYSVSAALNIQPHSARGMPLEAAAAWGNTYINQSRTNTGWGELYFVSVHFDRRVFCDELQHTH